MNSAKRRRLNDAASTLHKPFRSPLKPPVAAESKGEPVAEREDNYKLQHITKPSTSTQSVDEHVIENLSSQHSNALPATRIPSSSHRPATSPRKQDPEYLTLQRQHSALTRQLNELNQSADLVQQALKVEQSNQDPELEALILKWRTVVRDAAEELFSTARDRVNKMGGVGAWREKTQTPFHKQESWDEEVDEDNLTEEQKEELQIHKEETEREAEKYGLNEPEKVSEPGRDDESFTMAMMLRQLNIEFELVGYDKDAQRWVDDWPALMRG